MLTIKDLSASKDLDSAAMTSVRGGENLLPFGITNAPIIDVGAHVMAQGQIATVSQAGNLGGLNAAANYQSQFGISGQAVS